MRVGLAMLLTHDPQYLSMFSTGFNVGLSLCNRPWKKQRRTQKPHVQRHAFDPAH